MEITIDVPEEEAAALAAESAKRDESVKRLILDQISSFLASGCATPSSNSQLSSASFLASGCATPVNH